MGAGEPFFSVRGDASLISPPYFRGRLLRPPTMCQETQMRTSTKLARSAVAAAVLGASCASALGAICSPRDHGAKADGGSKDTIAIQECINAVSVKGVGTLREKQYGEVILSGGNFLSGPLALKRGVNLR